MPGSPPYLTFSCLAFPNAHIGHHLHCRHRSLSRQGVESDLELGHDALQTTKNGVRSCTRRRLWSGVRTSSRRQARPRRSGSCTAARLCRDRPSSNYASTTAGLPHQPTPKRRSIERTTLLDGEAIEVPPTPSRSGTKTVHPCYGGIGDFYTTRSTHRGCCSFLAFCAISAEASFLFAICFAIAHECRARLSPNPGVSGVQTMRQSA